VAITTLCCIGLLTGVASAGFDDWVCRSSNAAWCVSPYQHHSKRVEAWYNGSGSLPLAAGSYAGGWIFYTDTGISGSYNYVSACYVPGCASNSTILGTFNWQNRYATTHTVYGRDTF